MVTTRIEGCHERASLKMRFQCNGYGVCFATKKDYLFFSLSEDIWYLLLQVQTMP